MSSATLALAPKIGAMPFDEKPASGRTLSAGIAAEQDVWSPKKSIISTKTWTNSLLAQWHAVVQQVEIGEDPQLKASSTSAAPALTSPEFGFTLERIRELLADEVEQDRPSEEAFNRTLSLLRDTAKNVGMNFPVAVVATGPGRSIRLLWAKNEKELRVVIGGTAQNRSYIYWRHSGGSGVENRIDATRFAKYLAWLSRAV